MSTCFGRRGLACALLLLAAGQVQAQNRYFVGARNLGMGNTGVAGTTNAMAVHFNPAGLAFAQGWDLQVPLIEIDAGVESELFETVDAIADRYRTSSLDEVQTRMNNGTATLLDLQNVLQTFLYDLNDLALTQNGGGVRGITGPAFRWKNWAFSASVLGNGGVDTTVDLANGLSLSSVSFAAAIPNPVPNACAGDPACLALAGELVVASAGQLDQARAETLVIASGPAVTTDMRAHDLLVDIVEATSSGDVTLGDNQTGVVTTLMAAAQFTGSYSRLVWGDKLAVGGTLKAIRGEVSRTFAFVADLEDGQATLDEAINNLFDRDAETSTELSVDLGVMYRPTPKWSFGLVGSNLNSPEFDLPGGGTFQIDPALRAGAAFAPFRWFNVEANLDVIEVESRILRNLAYQYANVGAEFLVGRWLSAWVGAYKNTSASKSDPVYTGGLGFHLGRFELALSGAVSSDDIQVSTGDDADSYPTGAAAAITLAWNPKRLP